MTPLVTVTKSYKKLQKVTKILKSVTGKEVNYFKRIEAFTEPVTKSYGVPPIPANI